MAAASALDAKVCAICCKPYAGYGNNPVPLAQQGRCCDQCNTYVVRKRIDDLIGYDAYHAQPMPQVRSVTDVVDEILALVPPGHRLEEQMCEKVGFVRNDAIFRPGTPVTESWLDLIDVIVGLLGPCDQRKEPWQIAISYVMRGPPSGQQ
jgi:hypothetical protein